MRATSSLARHLKASASGSSAFPLCSLPRSAPASPSLSSSSSSLLSSSNSRSFFSLSDSIRSWREFNTAGLRYLNNNMLDEAEKMFLAAIREQQGRVIKGPHMYLSLANLGTVHRAKGNLKDSEDSFSLALSKLKPLEREMAPAVLANVFRGAGLTKELLRKWPETKKLYEEALSLYSSYLASAAGEKEKPQELQELKKERAGCAYGVNYVLQQQLLEEKEEEQKESLRKELLSSFAFCVQTASEAFEEDSLNMAGLLSEKGHFLASIGQKEEATQDLLKAVEIYKEKKDARVETPLRDYLLLLTGNDEEQVNELIQSLIVKEEVKE